MLSLGIMEAHHSCGITSARSSDCASAKALRTCSVGGA
jgi:hypothetical protein